VNGETERRFTRGLVEVRAAGDSRTIGGYAAKFNTLSRNLGGFVERIDPGFFAKSEGDGWPRVMARYNHDNNMLLGTSRSGTLRLVTDGTGLDYSVDVPAARADVYELVQRGDVAESSFAFRTLDDDWSMTEDGFPVRTLLSGQLVDVAPVNDPAYLDTSTGLRSLAERAGAELEEVRAAAQAGDLKPFLGTKRTTIDLAPEGGQGDTHPSLALRQRRAELYRRRTF
jgi:HK97 family phage prohead protease